MKRSLIIFVAVGVVARLVAACSAEETKSVANAREAGVREDAGTARADSGEADASRDSADSGRPSSDGRRIEIRFEARVGDEAFACGRTYRGVGSTRAAVEPADLRFFVQDLSLIAADGQLVPVMLDERAPWQVPGVALVDFEDRSGACGQGTEITNDRITGTVPEGDYRGLAFRNGVPVRMNHADPLTYPPPLQVSDLTWGWLTGFKFLVAELREVEAEEDAGADGARGIGLLHVGSVACDGNPGSAAVRCKRGNRNEVRFERFEPGREKVVIDVGRLFGEVDLKGDTRCHSDSVGCTELFEGVGLDWESGAGVEQKIFRVE